jgi:structural maintenance of chromosome 2
MITIGNKYLINGVTAQQQRVQNLFHSVQLNVNNPHFLIMQGKITKVLNMKPGEVLAMVEEAAGTRMYELKKETAVKTMEKKEGKVEEINRVLQEEITPTLEKLRKDKAEYMEWSANNVEAERLARFCTAAEYQAATENVEAFGGRKAEADAKVEAARGEREAAKAEASSLAEEIERIARDRQVAADGEVKGAERDAAEASKELVQRTAEHDHKKDSAAGEAKALKALLRSIEEARDSLAAKRRELEALQASSGAAGGAKEEHDRLSAQLVQMQREYEAVCTGISADGGGSSSLADQLMAAKREATAASTEAKKNATRVKHLEAQRAELAAKAKDAEKALTKSVGEREALVAQRDRLAAQAQASTFDPAEDARAREALKAAEADRARRAEAVEQLSAKLAALDFSYSDPEKGFDRRRVKGLVASLLSVSDPRHEAAIEVTAGGKLYNVVVDTETTGKQLLSKGQLKKRVTIIPLNKISSRPVSDAQLAAARAEVGADNVHVALELVGYPDEVQAAMDFVFGGTLVCTDSDAAKAVAFHKDVKVKAVTLEGDMFDPAGTLTGGSRAPGGSVLSRLRELHAAQAELAALDGRVAQLAAKCTALSQARAAHAKVTSELELKAHELSLLETRTASDPAFASLRALQAVTQELEQLAAATKRAAEAERAAEARCVELTAAMGDLSKHREGKVKALEAAIAQIKQRLAATASAAKDAKVRIETLGLECESAAREIASLEAQVPALEKSCAALDAEAAELGKVAEECRARYDALRRVVDDNRARLVAADKQLARLAKSRDQAQKRASDAEVEIKKLEHTAKSLVQDCDAARATLQRMEAKNPWIKTERALFGQPGTDYDFKAVSPAQAAKRLQAIADKQDRVSKTINKKVMASIESAEESYKELMNRKSTIERDKETIQATIQELDGRKGETMRAAWEKVNKDFGTIFSTLLPGATAKLEPPEGQTIAEGLEIKVAFSGKWKESLTELSGGQRSLCGLSLVLALLRFKPAPIYILDEVDAALDLNNTQALGRVIRSFPGSQFLVISLKDNLLTSANVIFKTKFVDGASTVTRTVGMAVNKENPVDDASAQGKARATAVKGKGIKSSN